MTLVLPTGGMYMDDFGWPVSQAVDGSEFTDQAQINSRTFPQPYINKGKKKNFGYKLNNWICAFAGTDRNITALSITNNITRLYQNGANWNGWHVSADDNLGYLNTANRLQSPSDSNRIKRNTTNISINADSTTDYNERIVGYRQWNTNDQTSGTEQYEVFATVDGSGDWAPYLEYESCSSYVAKLCLANNSNLTGQETRGNFVHLLVADEGIEE